MDHIRWIVCFKIFYDLYFLITLIVPDLNNFLSFCLLIKFVVKDLFDFHLIIDCIFLMHVNRVQVYNCDLSLFWIDLNILYLCVSFSFFIYLDFCFNRICLHIKIFFFFDFLIDFICLCNYFHYINFHFNQHNDWNHVSNCSHFNYLIMCRVFREYEHISFNDYIIVNLCDNFNVNSDIYFFYFFKVKVDFEIMVVLPFIEHDVNFDLYVIFHNKHCVDVNLVNNFIMVYNFLIKCKEFKECFLNVCIFCKNFFHYFIYIFKILN